MEEDVKKELNSEEKDANDNIGNDMAKELAKYESDLQTQRSKELEKCQTELDDTTDRLKRIMAEFENYKKRSLKERDNLYGSILSDIVEKMLPVLDNLEKATEADTKDKEYKNGIELVLKQYMDVLTSFGVKQIETVGTTFDPEIHEAVSSVQDDKYGEKEITQEYRKGYMIGTKVIRHAMVVVAN